MEERVETGATLERIRPRVEGGAFRRPPILPVVSLLMLFTGLAIGSRLAPAPPAAPPPTVALSATPSLVAVATLESVPTAPTEVLPQVVVAAGDQSVTYGFCGWDDNQATIDRLGDGCSRVQVAPDAAPPSGAISIEQAIAAAKARFAIDAGNVVSAQLTETSNYVAEGETKWVWELRLQVPGSAGCTFAYSQDGSVVTSEATCGQGLAVVIVDALSGEARSMTSVPYP